MYHKAKKSLGQNFLTSQAAVKDAILAAKLQSGSVVLEIGPGKGVLTEALLATGSIVYALEKDDILYENLKIKYNEEIKSGKLILIHADALDVFEEVVSKITLSKKSYSIVANIPYNITGLLLRMFLTTKYQPKLMVLMVQYEVASRILVRDKKESLLSLSVSCYGIPHIVRKVPAGSFSPAPKVDSALILIDNINRNNFLNTEHEELYFKIIHSGFAHKRKTLIGNLKSDFEEIDWFKIFETEKINPKIRAEDIHTAVFLKLAKVILTQNTVI